VGAEQLAARTPWTVDAIAKMVQRGVLKRGVHYFQPFGRRSQMIFKWSAVVALIERGSIPAGRGEAAGAISPRKTDVETATAELQRLLG
jgi:hypothetical protein